MSIAIEYLYHQKKVIADRHIPLDPRTYLKIYYKLDVLSEEAFEKTLQSMVDQLNSAYERDNVERIKIMDTDELGSSHAYMWRQDMEEFLRNFRQYLGLVKLNPELSKEPKATVTTAETSDATQNQISLAEKYLEHQKRLIRSGNLPMSPERFVKEVLVNDNAIHDLRNGLNHIAKKKALDDVYLPDSTEFAVIAKEDWIYLTETANMFIKLARENSKDFKRWRIKDTYDPNEDDEDDEDD